MRKFINMKTFKDYLIDFDSLNIGDKFYDSLFNEIVKTKMVHYNAIVTTKNDIIHKEQFKGMRFFEEKPDFFKEKKEVKKYKWYYELELVGVVSTLDGTTTTSKTEDEFIKWFKEQYPNSILMNYEKIDCTEIVVVVYE